MRHRRSVIVLALVGFGCSHGDSSPARPLDGPLASHARTVAAAHDVPGDLVLAVAAVEGGLRLPRLREVDPDDDVPVAGVMELRRGARDTLRRGAELSGLDEIVLRGDTDRGTEAGVRVLRELGATAPASSLVAWTDAVAELSGHRTPALRHDYVARVYRVLREGGTFPARDGETVRVPAHPEIPLGLTLSPPGRVLEDTPDSPVVTEWVTTPSAGKWDTSHDGKDYVAIHDTEGGWDASLATLQNDSGKSVQYMVDADGSRVAQFVHENVVAYHVGNYWYNQRTIGIEHVGKASDPAGYSPALYATSVKLVKDITSRHSIAIDRAHVFGHYQVPDGTLISQSSAPCADGLDACEKSPNYGGANNHRDPGYNWQWCEYMEKLGGTCECNDAWPSWNCTTDGTEAWRCNAGKLEKEVCTGGCVVMPVGTPDECKTSGAGGSGGGAAGTGGGAGSGGGAAGKAGAGGTGGAAGTSGAGAAAGNSAAGTGATAGRGGGTAGKSGAAAAGAGAAGAAAAAGAGTGGGGSGGAPTVLVPPASGESGSCAVGAGTAPGGAWVGVLAGLAVAGVRRRRRRE
jgi:MYXO-CTERM domain-containing protein